nr:zinc finger, CCHC-type, retrotransposon Gag domain protein [Tanacetum cinerariifolium]
EQECLKKEYHSIRQTNTETSTEFIQHFLRLVGFLGAAAGTEEEQAKNFQWGLRRSTLNHLMCMSYTDVAQVANAARNYEILHERDDDDAERPDKRQKSGDRHQPTSQQSSHRNHGHNNDRHGSDRRSGGDNHRSNNSYSGSNNRSTLNHLMCMSYTDVAQVANAARNYEILHERDDDDTERPDKRNSGYGRDQRNRGQQSNRSAISGSQQSRVPSEGYSYPTGEAVVTTTAAATTTTLATTTGISVMGVTRETGVSSPTDLSILVFSSPGVPLRATPTRYALRVDADTQESVVELLVPASSVVKLAICRRIARRTP